MNIAVIGAGNIGSTLGGKWAGAGHEVIYGVRDPRADKVQALLAQQGSRVRAATVADSAAGAGAVLLAVPAAAVADTVHSIGGDLNGKILIDATNKAGAMPMHQLDLLRRAAPDSALFRAFSNLGWENFAEPVIDGRQVDLFYCGDEGPSQPLVDALIGDIGLRPIYLGGVEQAGIVDALTRLWFNLALQQGLGRHLAFMMMSEKTQSLEG